MIVYGNEIIMPNFSIALLTLFCRVGWNICWFYCIKRV